MTTERTLLNTEEASSYLGVKPSYLYKLMHRHEIGYYKPNGKLCYFNKSDLDAWLTRCRVKSQDELEAEANAYIIRKEMKRR